MKSLFLFPTVLMLALASCTKTNSHQTTGKNLFIDEHILEPGKVTFADVMAVHRKDLATQGKYDVRFERFWVDEAKGKVYCLSSARDSISIARTHGEAHGLMPSRIFKVTAGF